MKYNVKSMFTKRLMEGSHLKIKSVPRILLYPGKMGDFTAVEKCNPEESVR